MLSLLQCEEGQGMAEYALIITLVALVVVAALTAMGGTLSDIVDNMTAAL